MAVTSAGIGRERITGADFVSGFHSLGGGEIRNGRAKRFYADGDGWSLAVSTEMGLVHDKVENTGGDLIWLACRAMGWSIGESLRWAEREGYRTPARRLTAAEVAEQRRQREERHRHRLMVADFRAALDAELDRAKLAAGDAGDDVALEQAASLQYRLANAPESVMAEMLERDGGRIRWLIEQGKADRENAAKVTRLAVELLARAEGVAHVAA